MNGKQFVSKKIPITFSQGCTYLPRLCNDIGGDHEVKSNAGVISGTIPVNGKPLLC